MALYGPATATATVTANTNAIAITGMDLSVVDAGMTINLGARDQLLGSAYLIASVSRNGQAGGTITTLASIPTGYANAAFIIDTRAYQGSEKSYAAEVNLQVLSAMQALFGVSTNLYSGSRQLYLDKAASTALSRVGFATAGRAWGDIAHRTLAFTPTGGQAASIEALAVRAFSDGTTPTDALLIDLSTGTGDLRRGTVAMGAAATVDLSSAPVGKVDIAGSATIASFGPGRNLDRDVRIVNGLTLTHSASLSLPGGQNIVAGAGDSFRALSDGAGNWRVTGYQRADGSPTVPWPKLLAGSGYIKLPSGLILQWGISSNNGADYTQPFPISFPNACLIVTAAVVFAPNTSTAFSTHVHTFSPTGFNVANRYAVANSVGTQGGLPVSFIAIGW
ncbi:UNVERIFIED_CONTAM: hypothetical protein Q9R58_22045 [Methylobacteriaceae bacterium AG10]|nr:hypothetical protein [Methylobacteriaceae bacterium AG10]